jgi:nicotinamidase-related amidase
MTLTWPEHFDPSRVSDLWVERAGMLSEAGEAHRAQHGYGLAGDDGTRIAAFGIDCQISFCHPDGGLFVPGAVEDAGRAIGWLYRHLDRVTETIWSLDTHELHQIFHPAFWRDREGRRPAPFTAITAAEVKAGQWVPRERFGRALEYCEKLEATGKYVLTVWPYHGILGGLANALLPAFAEAMCFHAFAREAPPRLVAKGRQPWTEMYSALSPEVRELEGETLGGFDEGLFRHLMSFDRVYVFGQASSHCVLATLEDLRDRVLAEDPSGLERFVILEDAMSPVPPPDLDPLPAGLDFPRIARERLDALVRAGMRRSTTAEPL